MFSNEPLLPTSEPDVNRTSKQATFFEARLITIGALVLGIGTVLLKIFPPSKLPPQYHSPLTSCSASAATDPVMEATGTAGQYYWAQQKGNPNKSGAALYFTPDCLSYKPTWVWADPFGATLRNTPLIDEKKNIYMSINDGRVLKFNQNGQMLWNYTSTSGTLPAVPALLNGMMISSSALGFVFALDMETGKKLWETRIADATSGDTSGILAVDGLVVLASVAGAIGNTQVVALTSQGLVKWRFTLKHGFETFNFQASSPGDGTVVFMDSSGGLYRLSLLTGDLIWESGIYPRKISTITQYFSLSFTFSWFSTGAAVVGPNGVVYCASNIRSSGIFHAYRLEDGKPLWRTNVSRLANTGLAVGHVAGSSELAVVGGIGFNPGAPTFFRVAFMCCCLLLPSGVCCCSCLLCRSWRNEGPRNGRKPLLMSKRLLVWLLMVLFWFVFILLISVAANNLSVSWKDVPGWLFLTRSHGQSVVALDAADGSLRWSYELPKFQRTASAGDEERLFARLRFGKGDLICLPDTFNQAVINGFGSTFIGHADGRLYAIKDSNSDRQIDPETEVSYYDFGDAFQAGVGLAPGLLAVVPCGGGLYVWKS